jgi:5'-3' exoribonuclease 2
MASDLMHMDSYKIEFELSKPFSPIGQLMGVLPARSAHCMPRGCRQLMTDPDSPIIDFYPENFALDMNGKRFAWQAVALLPWIDEKRLLSSLKELEKDFSGSAPPTSPLLTLELFLILSLILFSSINDTEEETERNK